MANIKSAQKRARQTVVKQARNLRRKTAIKTAFKKVLAALEGNNVAQAQELLRSAEGQINRAIGKGVVHKKTAMRKTSRLAKKVAAAAKARSAQ